MRPSVPTTSELKKIARNAQKRLDRVGDKWQTSSSSYQKQVDQWNTATFKKFIDIDDTGKMKFDISKLNNLSKSDRENLYLKFGNIQGVLDIEYDTQEMLRDPFTRQKISDDLQISFQDMKEEDILKQFSDNPAVIEKAEEIQKDFNNAIETYRKEGYTADQLINTANEILREKNENSDSLIGSVDNLHNSENSYQDLIEAGVEIWKALRVVKEEKQKQLANVKTEHDKRQEEYLRNRGLKNR